MIYKKIIESSIEFNKISNGAFDVTLGNTINQLGFGPKIFLNQKDNVIDYQEKFVLDDNLYYIFRIIFENLNKILNFYYLNYMRHHEGQFLY